MQNPDPSEQQLTALPSLSPPATPRSLADAVGPSRTPGYSTGAHDPILAYRIQEKAYGGLKPATQRRLSQLAESFEDGAPPKEMERVKPGTRLLREWRGQTHEVIATERGFQYRGQLHPSLSEIARHITGTRWSGPVFFGLRSRAAGGPES